MKRTIFIMAMAIATITVISCGKEEIQSSSSTGMTLYACMDEAQTSKATISTDWKFSFTENDKVMVTNSTLSDTYYTFTKGETYFTSADAQATSSTSNWYAFYPGIAIDLTAQVGTLADVANHFGYAGKQENVLAHTTTLSIKLSPQMSIIKVVNNKGTISLVAKTAEEKYILGMKASSNSPQFTVTTSDTKVALFGTTTEGTYYITVPTSIAFKLYDGDTELKSVAASTLEGGKYYTLTIGSPS